MKVQPYSPMHTQKLVFLFSALTLSFVALVYAISLQQNKETAVKLMPSSNVAVPLKSTETTNIRNLATGVHIDYLETYLPKPAEFVTFSKDRKQKERIYVMDSAYVQVVTNMDEAVQAYAVTFRKQTNDKQGSGIVEISPGKTMLSKVTENSQARQKCYGFRGNTTSSFYAEEYYFGNPGLYQTYVFGVNDAGFMAGTQQLGFSEGKIKTRDVFKSDKTGNMTFDEYDCASIPSTYRSSTPVNTYMVLAPGVQFSDIAFPFGVDRNQLRLMPE